MTMTGTVLNVRQIAQYPRAVPQTSDLMLLQTGGLGGSYISAQVSDFLSTAFTSGQILSAAGIELPATGVIGWANDAASQVLYNNALGGALGFTPSAGWRWDYANPDRAVTLARLGPDGNLTLELGTVAVARGPALPGEVVTLGYLQCCGVTSFNGRHGDVVLGSADVYNALQLHGTVATEQWVDATICASLQSFYASNAFVYSFNGRTGIVTLTADDITAAATAPGAQIQSRSPALGDASSRVATTLFVDESMDDLEQRILSEVSGSINLSGYAPLASPNFTGLPTAPTANPGTHTGQIATTAFVQAAVTASTTGVASFNTRTGAVTLLPADITGAGGALTASPTFTGTPAAPTAAPATSTTQLATCAFVTAAIAAIGAGVTSFNARTGTVTLTTADVTGAGGAPISSPTFTGTVRAPTAAPATNDTTIATTAYVTAAVTALGPGVASFNGRTGAVTLINNDISAAGGALIASPTFTGTPSAPTAVNGTNTTQLATCAFVFNEITALSAGVTSFNTRTGAVTLITSDITGAGGAPIASPNLTGVPTAPTAAQTSSDTTVATTAFVKAAIGAQSLVSSFNSRTGAVTLSSADVSAAGGALIASPTFTGTPAAPTATAGTSTTQLATTQFVTSAVNASVVTFNGRNGAVTLTSADITAAGGALLGSPTFTGTPNAPTPAAGTNNTQIATTAFVQAAITAGPYVPITGGTMTGFLVMPSMSASGSSANNINGPAGTHRILFGQTSGVARWGLDLGNSSAETGSNAGSDFNLYSYSDAGSAIATPLVISRATGNAQFAGNISGVFITASSGMYCNSIAVGQPGITDFYLSTSGTTRTITFSGAGGYSLSLDSAVGRFNFIGNSALQMNLDFAGNLTVTTKGYQPGGGPWAASSDARIKRVSGEYRRGLDAIDALRPVMYTYRGNDTDEPPDGGEAPYKNSANAGAARAGTAFIGLVAQDCEDIAPELLRRRAGFIDGKRVDDIRSMDGGPLVYMLINAVKELLARVRALEMAS